MLITPERIAALLRMSLTSYADHGQRVAMRGALGDAAALCDVMSSEIVSQNTRRGRINKRTAAAAAAFKRCGDEIFRMRDLINGPDFPGFTEAQIRAGLTVPAATEEIQP